MPRSLRLHRAEGGGIFRAEGIEALQHPPGRLPHRRNRALYFRAVVGRHGGERTNPGIVHRVMRLIERVERTQCACGRIADAVIPAAETAMMRGPQTVGRESLARLGWRRPPS